MSIERLNKAALAAGYAMAAPDEDTLIEQRPVQPRGEAVGRAIVPVAPSGEAAGSVPMLGANVAALAGWMRSLVPSFGGRAPA